MAMERAAAASGADSPAAIPQETEWWCRWCGKKVLLIGPADLHEQYRKAVHAATGFEQGGLDKHNAAPQNYEPPLWRSARILTAEFDGVFDISARFNMLRADWAGGGVAEHFIADSEEELRGKLTAAFTGAGLRPPALAEAPEAAR